MSIGSVYMYGPYLEKGPQVSVGIEVWGDVMEGVGGGDWGWGSACLVCTISSCDWQFVKSGQRKTKVGDLSKWNTLK